MQVREQAQRFIEALHGLEEGEESNVEALAALFRDDARLTNAALKLTEEAREGKGAIRAFWREYKRTVGKAHSDFHQVTLNDEAAGLFWTTRGASGSGESFQYDGSTLLVFDADGKIIRLDALYDTRQLNRALGTE